MAKSKVVRLVLWFCLAACSLLLMLFVVLRLSLLYFHLSGGIYFFLMLLFALLGFSVGKIFRFFCAQLFFYLLAVLFFLLLTAGVGQVMIGYGRSIYFCAADFFSALLALVAFGYPAGFEL